MPISAGKNQATKFHMAAADGSGTVFIYYLEFSLNRTLFREKSRTHTDWSVALCRTLSLSFWKLLLPKETSKDALNSKPWPTVSQYFSPKSQSFCPKRKRQRCQILWAYWPPYIVKIPPMTETDRERPYAVFGVFLFFSLFTNAFTWNAAFL